MIEQKKTGLNVQDSDQQIKDVKSSVNKIDWLMNKYTGFVRFSPYVAWYALAICLLQKDGFIHIPWFEFLFSLDWLLILQWVILMQYLGFRDSKFLV